MSSEYDNLVEEETARLLQTFNGKDDHLREQLSENGLGHLPFSDQTRNMLIRRLAIKRVQCVLKVEKPLPNSEESCSREDEKSDGSITDCSTSLNNLNKTHYAICIPGPDNQILIENDRLEVLKKMKEHVKKKPRMLIFSSYEDALAFAEKTSADDVCEGSIIRTNHPGEKAELEVNESVPFPSIGVPQLNQLRVLLEKGNVTVARQLIISNPRYLISTGDVPTILKIGPRFNALHACAFVGNVESCKMIMELLSDVELLRSMYGTQKRAEDYSIRLVDLYLNTPDKLANKTPLHFASERGFCEIVAFLVSFRACNRTARQQEIACDKYKGPDKAELTKQIQSLIKDGTCYVPLVRSDTTGPYAKIVKPFSPSSPHHLVEEIEKCLKPASTSQDMKDFSHLKLWAAAGPMSPQEAREFRRDWWSPRAKRKEIHPREPYLNVTDADRGFEHHGRRLADSHGVPWQEYWPFLDSFVDMSSLQGLKKLEAFLVKQRAITLYEISKTPITVEPFQISNDFVLETEKIENNEDSDSFVSANDFETAIERQTISKDRQSLPVEDDDDEDKTAYHDCNYNEYPFEADLNKFQDKKQQDSLLQKLQVGLSIIKDLFSPERKKSVLKPSSNYKANNVESSSVSSSSFMPTTAAKRSLLSSSSRDLLLSSHNELSNATADVQRIESSSMNDKGDLEGTSLLCSINKNVAQSAICETSCVAHSNENVMPNPVKNDDNLLRSIEINDRIIEPSSSSFDNKFEMLDVCKAIPLKSSPDQECSSYVETITSTHQQDAPLTSMPVQEWRYRNSIPIINSPDELSNVNEPEDVAETSLRTPRQDLKKEVLCQQPEHFEHNLCKEEDESFREKMNILCHNLERFKFQSPPHISPSETCLVECPETLKDDENQAPKMPSLLIFGEINASQFIADVESKLAICGGDVRSTVVPVVMLRQDEDFSEGSVLADVFIPRPSALRDEGLLMDETAWKDMHGNVWPNFLVIFPSWYDANLFSTLPGSVSAKVKVIGLPADKCNLPSRDKEFDSSRLKDAFLEVRKKETESSSFNESESQCLQCKVVRSSSIASKDVYVCGTIPTKMDGDVHRALNGKALHLIESTKDLSAVRKWFNKMKMHGKDIESLPSPSHILRSTLSREGSIPLSPLVNNELIASSKAIVQSPCSSKKANKDVLIRKLF